jgi:hypothetical protein
VKINFKIWRGIDKKNYDNYMNEGILITEFVALESV